MITNDIIDLDIENVYLNSNIDWRNFENKVVYITGSTGVIGGFLIRCLLYANQRSNLNIKVVAGVRNVEKAKMFFGTLADNIEFYVNDVNDRIDYVGNVDYIIHAASNTASASFVEKPVETFKVAVHGTENVLDFAREKNVKSVIYLSSMEVYGNINEPKPLIESDLGSLNLTDARSSYPMGKRAAETLCYNYAKEYNLPVKVVRLAQVIGANVDYHDTRVYAQFARSIVERKDIILHTKAQAIRSSCYITDVISGILITLLKGENGVCYNLASGYSSISEVANSLALKYPFVSVIYELQENNNYPPDTHWILDNSKLKSLGWDAKIPLDKMYQNLIESFLKQYESNK